MRRTAFHEHKCGEMTISHQSENDRLRAAVQGEQESRCPVCEGAGFIQPSEKSLPTDADKCR